MRLRNMLLIRCVNRYTLSFCGRHNNVQNHVRCIRTSCSLNYKDIEQRQSFLSRNVIRQRQYNVPSVLTIHRSYADKAQEKTQLLSNAEKLKKAVKEYGSTVIVFHIGISLLSLGFFYVLVSSGVDLTVILEKVGLSDEKINRLAGNAGTFVVAYAVHKIFAPVRIGITVTATPLIVRHLRKIGWLKK